MLAIYCKTLCFVKNELNHFNMENMCKTVSKIKENAGFNLGGNTIAIEWQHNKPNNSNFLYSMTM